MAKLVISVKLPEAHIHWAPLPQATSGDNDWKPIWLQVGGALSAWEHVEEKCALLFASLVESKTEAAYRAYGCIVSNGTKREMLENAVEVFFHKRKIIDQDKDYFYDLMKHLQKASAFRNEIAHSSVRGVMGDQALEYYLLPPMYNSRKTSGPSTEPSINEIFEIEPQELRRAKYRYTSKDVNTLGHRFEWLQKAFIAYLATTERWEQGGT